MEIKSVYFGSQLINLNYNAWNVSKWYMQIQFPIKTEKYILFTKNMRLALPMKPETAYIASHTEYINASEVKRR